MGIKEIYINVRIRKKKKPAFAQIILNTISREYFPYLNSIAHVLANSF